MTKTKEKNYITPVGFKRLSQELVNLLKVERPKITALVTWAASLGDRSENADYQYGKKRLREIDRRIRFLQNRLDLCEVVNPLQQKTTKVQFSATVKVQKENEDEKIYVIVGVDEVDLQKSYISWKSPLGTSLLGKEVGDSFEFRCPTGEKKEGEVLQIEYKEIL